MQDAVVSLNRLNEANIDHISLFMLGVAGKGKGIDNAINTASLINQTKPKLVLVCTLGVFPGSELEQEMLAGTFMPATELEVLQEEKKLLEEINLEDVPFFGLHPTNTVPLYGKLPQDKGKMLLSIDDIINNADQNMLNKSIHRSSL